MNFSYDQDTDSSFNSEARYPCLIPTVSGINAPMEVFRYNLGPLDNNTYLVADSDEAVVIDPSFESAAIIPDIETRGLRITAILNTHAHIDHVVENALFVGRFDVPLWLHPADLPLLEAMEVQAAWMGIPPPTPCVPTRWLNHGDSIPVGAGSLSVRHTPGHSPGHVTFFGVGFAIVGDVLFQDSVGRTDLPGGSLPELMESIQSALLPLADDTIVYPGHGPTTTIGREREHNPFLRELIVPAER